MTERRTDKAATIVATLGMKEHPEGGYYVETFRDAPAKGRGQSTAIYYLLEHGQRSHWHRIDAVEVWHYYRGAPLEILVWTEGNEVRRHILGPDVLCGERPQLVIPPLAWQTARPVETPGCENFSLVGCTVAPAFEFSGFELAPPDFAPEAGTLD